MSFSDSDSDYEFIESDSTKAQKIHAQDLQIKALKAKINVLESSGSQLVRNIRGMWEPVAPIRLNSTLKGFPEAKSQQFKKLLKTETNDDIAIYRSVDGKMSVVTFSEKKDYEVVSSFTNETWTSKITFANGQKGKIVKWMEGDKLRMVLKSNGEEMTILWKRIGEFGLFGLVFLLIVIVLVIVTTIDKLITKAF